MRPLETLFVLLTICIAVAIYGTRTKRLAQIAIVLAACVIVAHVIIEGGAHWQMLPSYIALGLVAFPLWKNTEGRKRARILVATLSLLFLAASATFCFLLPIFKLPKPTGSYQVGTTVLYLQDDSRRQDGEVGTGPRRELKVQVWYPAAPSRNPIAHYRDPKETQPFSSYQSIVPTNSRVDAPFSQAATNYPVVLFNHGWFGRRTQDTFLMEELASHGYITVSIDHPFNAKIVAFPDGRVIRGTAAADIVNPGISTPERVQEIWNKELITWEVDQHFVLDQLEALNRESSSRWFEKLNLHAVGAIGYSFGGAAAVQACAHDSRIRSSINMDGWFFKALEERKENQPLMVMNEANIRPTREEIASPDPNVRVEAILDDADFREIDASLGKFGGYRVYINGASHDDFTDEPLVSPVRQLAHRGTLPAQRMLSIVRTYVVAFFDKTLRGQDPALLRGPNSSHGEVSFENWPEHKADLAETHQLMTLEEK